MSDDMNHEEETHEEIHIEEEEMPTDEGRTWTEEIEMAGQGVVEFVQNLVNEGNVRRVTVRNSEGRILLDIPVALGAVAFLPPVFLYSALAVGVALLASCTISIEREAEPFGEVAKEEAEAV